MTLTNNTITGNTASSAGSTAEASMDQGVLYSEDELLTTDVDLNDNTVTVTATTTGTDATDTAVTEIEDGGIISTFGSGPIGMSRTQIKDNTVTVTATSAAGTADAKVTEGGIQLNEQVALNDVSIKSNTVMGATLPIGTSSTSALGYFTTDLYGSASDLSANTRSLDGIFAAWGEDDSANRIGSVLSPASSIDLSPARRTDSGFLVALATSRLIPKDKANLDWIFASLDDSDEDEDVLAIVDDGV